MTQRREFLKFLAASPLLTSYEAFAQEVEETLKSLEAKFNKLPDEQISEVIAKEIANGKTVGWFQGRMEFGPRAVGA